MKIINEKHYFVLLFLGVLLISNVFTKNSFEKNEKYVLSNANQKTKSQNKISKTGKKYFINC